MKRIALTVRVRFVYVKACLHVGGKDAQHSRGKRERWRRRGIDPHAVSVALYGIWRDCEERDVIACGALAAWRSEAIPTT